MADGKNTDAVLVGLSAMVEIVRLVQAYSENLGGDPEKIAAKIMRSEELSRAALKKWRNEPPPPEVD